MSLESGSQLGPYTVVGLLGEGGMGQVYRAKDSRLDREVAIKVLPPGVAEDPDALARFQREARAVAALSHPNILAIHDIGHEDGQHYVVYELIAGDTLRERIDGDGLDRRKAIELGYQIARGLGAAHAKGIVHRDLKPDNIMVSPDGQAKILDFGLSTWEEDGGSVAAETRTSLTHPGTVMGTVGYMAPEQVRGQPADSRSDIFSFGALLYEMLTGRRAFERETTAETMTAILRETPEDPVTPLPSSTLSILLRCLAKRPEERFHSADDLAFALESTQNQSSASFSGIHAMVEEPAPRRKFGRLAIGIAIAAGLAGLLIGSQLLPRSQSPDPPSSFQLRRMTYERGEELHATLAPHGRTVAYTAYVEGTPRIFARRVGGESPLELAQGSLPAFSPNGDQIAFVHIDGGIWVMGATGESPRRLTETGFNPAWSPDGREIVASCEYISGPLGRQSPFCSLTRIDVSSGATRTLEMNIRDAVQPNWSPSGERIAFWGLPERSGNRTLFTMSADGGEAIPLTDDSFFNWNPVWSKDGRWLYFASDRGGPMNIWRLPIDESTGQARGPVEPVTTTTSDVGMFSIATDGSLIFSARTEYNRLARVPFDFDSPRTTGPKETVLEGSRDISNPELSPDSRRIAFVSRDLTEDLYIYERDSGSVRRLTNDTFRDRGPRWVGNDQLVFFSDRSGRYEAWRVGADGSGLQQLTESDSLRGYSPLPNSTGTAVVFHLDQGAETYDLTGDLPQSTSIPLPPIADGQFFVGGRWSPDSTRLLGRSLTEPGLLIFDPADGETPYQILSEENGMVYWLDNVRVAVHASGNRLLLFDTIRRELISETTLNDGIIFAVDDTAIYTIDFEARTDLWLLTPSPEFRAESAGRSD